MHKGIKQTSYFVILLVVLFFIIKINSTKTIEKSFSYDFDVITINLQKDASESALNAFNDFSAHFSDVYIDSTDIYNIQNALKITDFENLEFQFNLLKCKDFNQLFHFINTYISDKDLYTNLNHLRTINLFLETIKEFLLSYDESSDVGHELLLSLITDYDSNNSLNNRKIVLKVHRNASYSDIYLLINDFNKRISTIDYVVVNNKEMLDRFIVYNKASKNPIKIKLDEYYLVMSKSLNDLIKMSNLITIDSDFFKLKGMFQYINNNTVVRGERFKTIRNFPINSKDNHQKKYLNKNDFLNYLNHFSYELNQMNEDLIVNFDLNVLKNDLILNISHLYAIIENNDLDQYYLFIQDDFIAKRLEYLNNFCNIEPLTLDYLNSSIKKEFYDDENNVFISKIYLKNQSKQYKKYIHSLFNENTTIFK